ncbi:GNAT family N-acetyltransferase [Novosphingobium colocasiae]|uniref:GNAT family N-acetyltransferase n=1 Tax=Novosphingobium colocasiae TaxID=1256513 RepID=UPI0035B130CA
MPDRITAADLAARPALANALLALNNAHAQELSLLDEHRLRGMIAMAFHAAATSDGSALLIAFDQSADYDSPNFMWLRERLERFVYVDRVVVAASARGRGLARAFYADLFEQARAAGHDRVVCEVNLDPPNPASDAFHASLGFAEIGSATLPNAKTVRYLERLL